VVEFEKPFLSETGYRSFVGVHADLVPGLTPEVFVRKVIAEHIKGPCKGKLRPVKPEYRGRYSAVNAGRADTFGRFRFRIGSGPNWVQMIADDSR
jgi:hypothetical protein